jgi:hypothetical protein
LPAAPGDCRLPALEVDPEQILITTGSQQALDLIGKVFLDKGSRLLVKSPPTWAPCRPSPPWSPWPWAWTAMTKAC